MKDFSYSKINLYNKCPKQFKFNYIDKEEGKTTEYNSRNRGIVIHDILSTIVETRSLSKSTNLTIEKYGGIYNYEDILEAEDIISNWLDEDRFPYSVEGVELDLKFNLGEYKVRAILDRLDKINDEIYRIVDYKSGNFEYKKVTDSLQFEIYALAVFNTYKECNMIEVVYENIIYGTSVSGTVRREEMEQIQDRIISYIKVIENDNSYEPRLTYDCVYCVFNDKCEEFNDWLTMDNKIEKSKEAVAKKFLEYRTKSRYYNDLLETSKEILHLYGDGIEIEGENEIVIVTDGRINVRRK